MRAYAEGGYAQIFSLRQIHKTLQYFLFPQRRLRFPETERSNSSGLFLAAEENGFSRSAGTLTFHRELPDQNRSDSKFSKAKFLFPERAVFLRRILSQCSNACEGGGPGCRGSYLLRRFPILP
jgi:hypothetical protein